MPEHCSDKGDKEEATKVAELVVEGSARNFESADSIEDCPYKTQLLSAKLYLAQCYVDSERLSEGKPILQDILSDIEEVDGQTALDLKAQCHHTLGSIAWIHDEWKNARNHRSCALEYYR